MNDFDSLTAGLILQQTDIENTSQKKIENPFITESIPEPIKQVSKPIIKKQQNSSLTLFDTASFQKELRDRSIKKNKSYALYSENITAYDIASGCSRSVFYRIKNIPTNNYANKWLPVN